MEKRILINRSIEIIQDHKIFSASFVTLPERTRLLPAIHTFNTEEEIISFIVLNTSKNVGLFLRHFISNCGMIYLIGDARRFCTSVSIITGSSLTNPSLIGEILLNKVHGFISKHMLAKSEYHSVTELVTHIFASRHIAQD